MKRTMTILMMGAAMALYSSVALAANCNEGDAPKKKACTVSGGGNGVSESTCVEGKWSKFGGCANIVCPPGMAIEEGAAKPKCVGKKVKECSETDEVVLTPCNIPNGIGEKTRKCTSKGKWGGWNKCQLKECNAGYSDTNGKCKKMKKIVTPVEGV